MVQRMSLLLNPLVPPSPNKILTTQSLINTGMKAMYMVQRDESLPELSSVKEGTNGVVRCCL